METDPGIKAKQNQSLAIILGVTALIATIYNLIMLSPLFSTFFIRDDFLFLDMGPVMRHNPLVFLTATCIGWWRPIAMVLPALTYLIFGFNPFPFHLLAYLIHLFAGITLLFLAKRLFNLRVGLIAYIIYITAPIAFSNVGWMLGAMEDETAAIFFFLALLTQLRQKSETSITNKPYYLPTLFLVLASFCKITWLGLIPAMLLTDWINYPTSNLKERLFRIWPFTVFIPLLLLNFVIIGFAGLGGTFLPNFNTYYTSINLTWGATLPFLPNDLFIRQPLWFYSRFFMPLFFFLIPLFLFKSERTRILLLITAYLGLLAILGLASLNYEPEGWVMGWRHLTPLVGIASLLIALSLAKVAGKLGFQPIAWFIVLVALGLFNLLGLGIDRTLTEDTIYEQGFYKGYVRGLLDLTSSFPKGSQIYVTGTKAIAVNILRELVGSDRELIVLVVERSNRQLMHNYDANSKYLLIKDLSDIEDLLMKQIREPNTRIIKTSNWLWFDVTDSYKEELDTYRPISRP